MCHRVSDVKTVVALCYLFKVAPERRFVLPLDKLRHCCPEKCHNSGRNFCFLADEKVPAWRIRGVKNPKILVTILEDSKRFQKHEGRGSQRIPSSPDLFQTILNYFKV